MLQGKIKFLGNGFGFITLTGEKDIFFHSSGLRDCMFSDLKIGDSVEIEEIVDGERGKKAQGVKVINY